MQIKTLNTPEELARATARKFINENWGKPEVDDWEPCPLAGCHHCDEYTTYRSSRYAFDAHMYRKEVDALREELAVQTARGDEHLAAYFHEKSLSDGRALRIEKLEEELATVRVTIDEHVSAVEEAMDHVRTFELLRDREIKVARKQAMREGFNIAAQYLTDPNNDNPAERDLKAKFALVDND